MREKRVVACNFAEATGIARPGAKSYVVNPNPGWGTEQMQIVLRSRGGRWVEKWESLKRLTNFRVVTLVEAEGEPFDKAYPAEDVGHPTENRRDADAWCSWMNAEGAKLRAKGA